MCTSAKEELGTLAENNPLTSYEPNSSTTTRSQRPLKSSSRSPPATAGPRTCMTKSSVTTPSAERSLHHCSPKSEKMQRAVDKLITLSFEESLLPAQSFSVCHSRTVKPLHELSSLNSWSREKPSRDSEKRANQDSPCKTKRADSRRFQSRDSETRVPSRF